MGHIGQLRKAMMACLLLVVLLPSISVGEERIAAGEMIIKVAPGYSAESISSRIGVTLGRHLPHLDVYMMYAPPEYDLDSLAAVTATVEGVEFCHPNFTVDPLQSVQGSLPVSDQQRQGDYEDQPAVEQIGLSTTRSITTGSWVRVAVLDGGVDYGHPALSQSVIPRSDFIDFDDDPMDEIGGANSGHGTFVAGVMHLVAPKAEVYAYRVTDLDGLSDGWIVAEAILQAVDDGCRVINLSLVTVEEHKAIAAAVAYAVEHNVLVVAAAGNGFTDDAHYPASDPNVLSVAAVDPNNLLADFSSYGEHVDICAPGVSIYGPYVDDSYAWWGGTSFAAPFVAAQAALLWHFEPEASLDRVKDAILSTATSLDDDNPELAGELGEGLMNPLGSILAIRGGANAIRVPEMYSTIAAAVDAALPGDTVLVAPGEYYEHIEIQGKAVYLISELGAANTILRPLSPSYYILDNRSGYYGRPEIRGFTFTGASATAVNLGSGAVMSDNIFIDNFLTGSNQNNEDSAPCGGHYAIRVKSAYHASEIKRNVFIRNHGSGAILVDNTWDIDQSFKYPEIVNNTFVDNDRGIVLGCDLYATNQTHINKLLNNIFYGTQNEAISLSDDFYEDFQNGDLVEEAAYNIFWDNTTDWTPELEIDPLEQLFVDPTMVSPSSGDVRLMPGSPAIDAGHPDIAYNDPDDSRNDIGACPYEPVEFPLASEFGAEHRNTLTPVFTWEFLGLDGTSQVQYQIQGGTDDDWTVAELWDTDPVASSATSCVYTGTSLDRVTGYYFRIRLHDGNGWGAWRQVKLAFYDGDAIYVPGDTTIIQRAIDLLEPGGTVYLAPGTYYETLTVGSKDVAVIGTEGPDETFINPPLGGSPGMFVYDGGEVLVQGVTFTGQKRYIRTYDEARFEIRDCRFGKTDWPGYPTIQVNGSDQVTVVGCEFLGSGRAVDSYESDLRFDSNLVVDCRSGVKAKYGSMLVRENIIRGTQEDWGIDGSHLTQSLIADNTVINSVEGGIIASGDVNVVNNIVAWCGGYGLYKSYLPGSISFDYNLAYLNMGGDRGAYLHNLDCFGPNELTTDPLFLDTIGNDLALQPNSPCIDAGDPDPIFNDPDGSRSDIGATHTLAQYPLAMDLSFSPTNQFDIVRSLTPTLAWVYTDETAGMQAEYQVQVGTDPYFESGLIWDSGPTTSSDQSMTYAGPSLVDRATYFWRVRVSDGAQWGDWIRTKATLNSKSRLYVPGDFATIQSAINATLDGDTVTVGDGIWYEKPDFGGHNIVLNSLNGRDATIIGEPLVHLETSIKLNSGESAFATLADLTIRGRIYVNEAAVTIQGCFISDGKPIAVQVESSIEQVVIKDNVFTGNYTAVHALESSVLVEQNEIVDNGAVDGPTSAMKLEECKNSYIHRNLFISNESLVGAGVYVIDSRDTRIHNNTFYGNRCYGRLNYADDEGGACIKLYLAPEEVDVRNNIFMNNGPGYAINSNPEIDPESLEYNCFYQNTEADCLSCTPGDGTITADPLFEDPDNGNFHLLAGSPCIDAGDPSFAFVDPDGTRSDVGALRDESPTVYPLAVELSLGDQPFERVTTLTPELSWTYEGGAAPQQAYEVEIKPYPLDGSVIWSTGTVYSSDNAVTYDGPELSWGANYMAWIRVFDGTDWGNWRYLAFHTNGYPEESRPGQPAVGNEAMAFRCIPYLSCEKVTDPDGDTVFYDYQFGTDPTFAESIFSFERVPSSSIAIDFLADLDVVYYWRCRTSDGDLYTDWNLTEVPLPAVAGGVPLLWPKRDIAPSGQPFTIDFGVNISPTDGNSMFLLSTFRLYSPDGADFEPANVQWINSEVAWQDVCWVGDIADARHGASEDTIVFLGGSGVVEEGLIPADVDVPAYRIITEVSSDDLGKHICIDKVDMMNRQVGWIHQAMSYPDNDLTYHYPQWDGPYCFTISECCQGVRGDVNDDGRDGTISDVSAMIDHLFINCQNLACFDEANINADQYDRVTISDISSLIDHLFINQNPLLDCDFIAAKYAPVAANEPVTIWVNQTADSTELYVSSDFDLVGVHLKLVGASRGTARIAKGLPLDMLQGRGDDTLRVGLLDTDGPGVIPAGSHALMSVPGQVDVVMAEVGDLENTTIVADIRNGSPNLPTRFELAQNYPNPFNPTTNIAYAVPSRSHVKISVFNILGQTVATLVDKDVEPGRYSVTWDGTSVSGGTVATGVYLYRFQAGDYQETRKMLLLK